MKTNLVKIVPLLFVLINGQSLQYKTMTTTEQKQANLSFTPNSGNAMILIPKAKDFAAYRVKSTWEYSEMQAQYKPCV